MKTNVIITILIIILTYSCSPKDEVKLDGIFELRLGMSEKEIRKKVDETLLKANMKKITYYSGEAILKERLKGFSLEAYIVNNTYKMEKIHLSFFDDQLYNIKIEEYNPKIEEFLTRKYGEPLEELEEYGTITTWSTYDDELSCFSANYIDHTYFLSITQERIEREVLRLRRLEAEIKAN